MAAEGVTRRWGGHYAWMVSGRRSLIALSMGAALLIALSMAPAATATTGIAADTPTETSTDTPAEGEAEQPADDQTGDPADAESDADDAVDEGDAEDAPEDSGSSRNTHGYGGGSAGPADLRVLLDDPNYPIVAPPSSEELPPTLDVVSPYLDNLICDPVERPGVLAFGNLIGEHYDRPYFSTHRAACASHKSLHHEGRALDWPLDAYDPWDRRIGDEVSLWLTANNGEMAARFGVSQIIWNERVWYAWDPDQWYAYVGVSPHTDHVHFGFSWDGAQMRTSWWTGVPVVEADLGPCPAVAGTPAAITHTPRYDDCAVSAITPPITDYSTVYPFGEGPGVEAFQSALGLPVSGVLDSATRAVLLDWQEYNAVPRTGVLDQFSYAALLGDPDLPDLPAQALGSGVPEHAITPFTAVKDLELSVGAIGPEVELLQTALGIEADGVFGAGTEAALLDYTSAHPWLRPTASTDLLTWHLLEREMYATLDVRHIELAPGDESPIVELLQHQLDVDLDGRFGPLTQAAVEQAQAEHGLPVTGVVDAATWAVVDTGEYVSPYWVDEYGRTWYRGWIKLELDDLPVAQS